LQGLKEQLRSIEFGKSAQATVAVCREIVEIDRQTARKELVLLLEELQMTQKRWAQFCRIGRDLRLSKNYSSLPSTITSLYALTTLTNDELNDGIITGELHREISSREIYAYARECRLRSRAFSDTAEVVPCCLALSTKGKELDSTEIDDLLKKANSILTKNGIMIIRSVSSTSKFDDRQKELIDQEQKQGRIETEIEHQMYMASTGLSNYFSVEKIDQIMEGEMSRFVRALASISRSRIEMMQTYGTVYCYKIALEYHRSSSRVQRYNYKRRLVHVQSKYPFLATIVEKIFSDLIERPRKVDYSDSVAEYKMPTEQQ
jgi:hypothetical protein